MIDEKFSAMSFAKNGLDTDSSRELADLLEKRIKEELQQVVEHKFKEIVGTLNSMGHSLKPEQEALGEISYKDDYDDSDGYHCKLRIAVDYVTSAGYAHLSESKDFQ